jgi:hypothetical protein
MCVLCIFMCREQVPDAVEINVPAGGWKVGEEVIVTLPGEEQQQVRVTISQQTAMAAVPGTPLRLPIAEGGALYRIELRGGCVDDSGCHCCPVCSMSLHASQLRRAISAHQSADGYCITTGEQIGCHVRKC